MSTPKPEKVARDVVGAMVALEPVVPLGWATARDDFGRPLYLVAVVMGSENCIKFDKLLTKLQEHMEPVDTFNGTPGEPVGAGT